VKLHANARQGFVETETFWKLLAALKSDDLRDFVEWLWWTGMRPGEAASLTWEGYQKDAAELRLTAAAAKIGRARTVPLIPVLAAIIKRRADRRLVGCRRIFHKAGHSLCDKRGGLQHRNYSDWYAACEAIGLPGSGQDGRLLPYDLRRTAARNLVRAGVSIKVAMEITGHLTRATFDRYDIADRADVRAGLEAVARLAGGPGQHSDNGSKK
jgi:integrase